MAQPYSATALAHERARRLAAERLRQLLARAVVVARVEAQPREVERRDGRARVRAGRLGELALGRATIARAVGGHAARRLCGHPLHHAGLLAPGQPPTSAPRC
jgi:hypothetical protein